MTLFPVKCCLCGKLIFRSRRRINEAEKFRWNTYCSAKCQSHIKNKQQLLKCSRSGCNKTFKRQLSDLKKSQNVYCSRSCAVIVNNTKYPKNPGVREKCGYCGKEFVSREKYCSKMCKDQGMVVTRNEIVKKIATLQGVNPAGRKSRLSASTIFGGNSSLCQEHREFLPRS